MIFKKKTEEEKTQNKQEKVQKLMDKFGITAKKIDAEEVEIHTRDKDIVITKPEIMITSVMDKEVYQITGTVKEIPKIIAPAKKTKEEDVEMIMERTGKDRDTVMRTLQNLDYDLAKAIRELRKMENR